MRTKILLLTAAAAAAGTLATNAQVFSVNAVGYVNKTVPAKGLALISNPLTATDNKVSTLLSGAQGLVEGTTVFVWDTTAKKFVTASFQGADFGWDGPAASLEIKPGQGMFVKNPGAADLKITFVGEVPQGNLSTPIVAGLQIISSQVPQAGTPDVLGFQGSEGDKAYFWNTTTQKYDTAVNQGADFGWDPPLKNLDVGDAFFLSTAKAGTWTRTFTVNQ